MKKIKVSSLVILTNLIILLGQENISIGKIPDIDFTSVTNVIDDGTDKVMDFVATPAVQNAKGEAEDLCLSLIHI